MKIQCLLLTINTKIILTCRESIDISDCEEITWNETTTKNINFLTRLLQSNMKQL